ncbi:MAG: peptidylprolyl isomerase [Dehalococcoidia bacterium]|jgi:cyclophilin family peptidyl-prolyl cis-trans isomerase
MKSSILKMSLVFAVAPALILLVASSCGGGSSNTVATPGSAAKATIPAQPGQVIVTGNTPTPSSSQLPPRTGDFASLCTKSSAKTFAKADTVIDPSKKYTATLTTQNGAIVIELEPNLAPVTVNSFVFLACKGFYDGTTFHRVISGFMAQGGDPTGTGRGGPGYTIPDEFTSSSFDRGTVAMANTGQPNSGGSQFFITFAPQPQLSGGYTVFGQVTSGLDVLDKITPRDPATATTPGDEIVSITVQEH